MTSPLVSVVVPCYNEAENIPLVYAAVEQSLAGTEYAFECVFVNDGSTDNTREVLRELAGKYPSTVRPVHLVRNSGQSAAMLAGFSVARGAFILTIDGDLQNDPADFPRFLELLRDYDCVCGYRANRQDSLVRKISSRVANVVRNWILHDGIRDSGCGIKGYRRVCLRHIPPFNGAHRFIAVFIRRAGLTLVECPVRHHPRRHGVSKYGIGNRLWRGIYDLFGVAWLRKRFVAPEIESSPEDARDNP
ncbi:MAG TPA: glycosyltransferase family 2 protein [Candidatus Hydrogenedentes bacterium]|nr:glycosyltransferase family 2 protein [Candidatus Hydrogenedentota bacterium]